MAIRSSWATGEVLTSDDLTDTVADKVSRQGDTLSGQLDSAQLTPMHQFAADGSVLSNLPARVHPAEQLLKQAVWWIDAAHSSASGQSVKNLGWGGSALDAQVGSTGSADSNDPKYLAWEGENYVYCPGVAGNYLSVPDEAALDITGDIDIRVKVALDDWTPAAEMCSLAKWYTGGNQRSYYLIHRTSGQLRFIWSPDGTSVAFATSTAAVPFSDGETGWCRAAMDVDDGGVYKVYFYTSTDGVTWSALGSTVTGGVATSIHAGTEGVEIGTFQRGTNGLLAGKVYRAIVKDGIDGTTVLDADCSQITSGADTSFTALTGQTVSINRSTSGRKTVGVVHPRWLFGTDDYMQVADNDLLDFGASDSFTVLAVTRGWATFGTFDAIIAKKASNSSAVAGWLLRNGGTTGSEFGFNIGDGVAGTTIGYSARPAAALTVIAGVRDVGADTINGVLNGVAGTPVTDTTAGSLASSEVMRVGRMSGAGAEYADMEFIAAAVFRRALTSGEIATLNSYFQGRG